MARVKSFKLHKDFGVPDQAIAAFVTECEKEFYVNVQSVYMPEPSPRICVIVTKLDLKEQHESNTSTK